MTDHKELRRLAAAATPGEWTVDPDSWTENWLRGQVLKIADHEPHDSCSGNVVICAFGGSKTPDAAFIAAANPKAVTALLDESDRMEALCLDYIAQREKAEAERDQLRAASGTLVGHIIGVQVFLQSLGTPLAHDLVKLGTVAIKDATEALATPLPAAATPATGDKS